MTKVVISDQRENDVLRDGKSILAFTEIKAGLKTSLLARNHMICASRHLRCNSPLALHSLESREFLAHLPLLSIPLNYVSLFNHPNQGSQQSPFSIWNFHTFIPLLETDRQQVSFIFHTQRWKEEQKVSIQNFKLQNSKYGLET